MRSNASQLYPEPHSPLFDFDSTASGAEWIDDLARRAVALRAKDQSGNVVAHTDWSARNVRFDKKRLLAYTARCEHSLAARGIAREDQSTARERLAEIGTALLGTDRSGW